MSNRILLVEDDPINVKFIQTVLVKKGGYEVVTCRDGAEALTLATTARPQLIVMDVMMPGLDGLSAIRQLKQNDETRQIPVVVLSAKGHALTRVEAEAAGAALFLAKPFSPNQLLSEVKKILGQS